jgi:periplasmic divalent cation tolerance protein
MSKLAVIYITFPNRTEAKALAGRLLEKRLIACANIYDIDSMYRWEGKVMDEKEVVLWAKTRESNIQDIKSFVSENHSYDVPCIAHFPFDANEAYADWVESETRH